MNKYRGVKYETHGKNFIKLTNLAIVDAISYKEGETYPNGIRFVSVPNCYKNTPEIFAKRCIDRMYEHKLYFDGLHQKKLIGDYKSRTGYTIEKMKEKR